MTRNKNPLGLVFLIFVCIALLVPALLAWAVNVEVALQSMNVETTWVQRLLPGAWYAVFTPLAGDLSTISTLVPLLLLVFPLFMGLRILVLQRIDSTYVHRVIYDPYPPHFPFFLVMLGLTGTLYGLLIGLSASGVGELGSETPSADAIQETIDRLMGGTATALLSSLVGLVGAFLAARPLTWLFRSTAGIPEEESQRNLIDVISALTRDLQALGHASREFSERLNVASAERLDQRLSQIDRSLGHLVRDAGEANTRFQKLIELQEKQAEHFEHLKNFAELKRLAGMEDTVSAAGERVAQLRESVDGLQADQAKSRAATEEAVQALHDGNRDSLQALHGIHALLETNSRDNRADRGALRNALEQYLTNLTQNSE